MIDTHCHLLPGLDDGPPDMVEALALARCLLDDGVEHVLCTPHYSPRFPTSLGAAEARLRDLRSALAAAGLDLDVSLAAEVAPAHVATATVEELARRSFGGRYLVVEALPDVGPLFFELVVERLQPAGLLPVFAHPERCRALHRRPGLVDEVRRAGALVQIVAPSLAGRWGTDVANAAWRLVNTGRADLLASDAHGAGRRRPHLRTAAEQVAERLGTNVAAELTVHQPKHVLAGTAPGGGDSGAAVVAY